MKIQLLVLPVGALAAASLLLTPSESIGFSTIGGSLSQSQRDFRVFDNFTDSQANNNTTADPDWPGYTGAELAIWKGCAEWGSELHGASGAGDPTQTAIGGSGANFDTTFQGNANGVGTSNNNIHSEISGNGGSTLAFAETPISDGWRIRYYQNWTWQDGPGSVTSGSDLQGIACHEYGHALGLGHSNDNQATMYFAAIGTGQANRSIEADDQAGVQFIYGVVDPNVKPVIAGVTVSGNTVTVLGRNFSNNNNELWFTQAGTGGNGQAVKATGLSSVNNSILTATIPGAAGPGDILVRKGGNSGFSGLSNAWPFDPSVEAGEATVANIDMGTSEGTPGTGQGGAAGNTGAWNPVALPVGAASLFEPDFTSTQGVLTHTGSNGEIVFDDPSSTGFYAKIYDDGHDVGCIPGDSVTYTFDGFAAGTYDVYVYSWVLEDPVNSFTNVTVNGGSLGAQSVGGIPYQAALINGGNYVRDTVSITSGQAITVTAAQSQGCARVNGFQIVPGTACGVATNYCTPGTSASGCQATMSALGTPSATAPNGFSLVASNVEGAKDGLFFYGTNGQQANPWGSGTSFQCVTPPVFRGGLIVGTGTNGACDGNFTQDLNALWTAVPAKNPGPGANVNAQLWYRDPQNTSNQTTSLSDGLNFLVCP